MGASGSGKSTIQHSLPPMIKFMTHFTTRALREGEIDGFHIHHCTREYFEALYSFGEIATRTEYAGNLYGAPMIYIADIKAFGTTYHATATIDSIEQFRKLLGDDAVVSIYIKPPSIEALRQRMIDRGDSAEDIERRIKNIESDAELENEKYADYVVINDDLETAKSVVRGIIYMELYETRKINYENCDSE